MIQLCQTCKYWTAPAPGAFREPFGDCRMPGDADSGVKGISVAAAVYGPYGEGGTLITLPTFSCAEWGQK